MSAAIRLAPTRAQRIAMRQAWVRAMAEAWGDAQREMDRRCMAAVGRVSEEEFHRIFDEEGAEVERFRAQLVAVAERDMWPRELHWGCL